MIDKSMPYKLTAGRALFAIPVLGLLAACATRTHITAIPASAADMQPVTVVAALTTGSGPRYNAHGGVIPEAAPTVPVDESPIGEVPN